MKNLFPKKYRIALTIGAFITLPIVLTGMWFLWRELFFDHWKKPVKVETPSAQSITKESVDKLNATLKSGKKSDCKEISSSILRDICNDTFTIGEAKQSPLQAQEICSTIRRKADQDVCMSNVNVEKAFAFSGSTPSAWCDLLTDQSWKRACTEEKDMDALTKKRNNWAIQKEFCDSLVTERIKKACLSYIK